MSGEDDAIRIAELTAENQKNIKPIKLSKTKTKLDDLIKEGKNKFRKKYRFVVYCQSSSSSSGDGEDQNIYTDEDLCRVLQLHEGKLRFRLTNTAPADSGKDKPINIVQSSGVVYIIGNEEDTENNAIDQLKYAGRLKGCVLAVGMPDLHAGRDVPIGATIMTTQGVAYPQFVDKDIGCGMSFVQTSIQRGKLNTNRAQKMADKLHSIDCPYFAHVEDAREACSEPLHWGSRTLEPLPELELHHYDKLGTVGGGNHFAELQEFEDIFDEEACAKYGIDTSKAHLLVHSGSRSLGAQYIGEFCDKASKTMKSGPYPAETDSALFRDYLNNHDVAINYAVRNRQLIAKRLLKQLTPGDSAAPVCKVDIIHNFLEKAEIDSLDELKSMARDQGLFPKRIKSINDDTGGSHMKQKTVGWIHRKGATPTTQSKILVIPGSRGSLSYLVEVNEEAHHGSAYSLAHGAGRKLKRSTARERHQAQYPNPRKLLQTDLGGVVCCEEKDLVYEEAPASYKNIDRVVECLTEVKLVGHDGCDYKDGDTSGLVRVLATLRPILTYKFKNPR